jgi:small-conductance mechanosensitive channel
MYTQLTKGSGELVWYPNTQLQQMAIVNISRSGPRWEGHTWLLDMDTPNEVRIQADISTHVQLPTIT